MNPRPGLSRPSTAVPSGTAAAEPLRRPAVMAQRVGVVEVCRALPHRRVVEKVVDTEAKQLLGSAWVQE